MLEFQNSPAEPTTYLPEKSGVTHRLGSRQVGRAQSLSGRGSISQIVDFIDASGYTFMPWQVATLVTAIRTKPFVILAGISGTGKTKLPQLVARATGAECCVVPVRPDWTDSSELIGYERINGEFVPGALLRVCEEAMRFPTKEYFFILDEMNIARVEYYFAEVLSVMENREWQDGKIVTPPLLRPGSIESCTGSGPDWASVILPPNVALIGTVNMDETTHGFSRKVMDRAFVLELSEVDLADFGNADRPPVEPAVWTSDDWGSEYLRLSDLDDAGANETVIEVVRALTRCNDSLTPAQLQVGYRVRDEISLFCINASRESDLFVESDESTVAPLDLCLYMKVLPRIQGSGDHLGQVIADLLEWIKPQLPNGSDPEGPVGFSRTNDRLVLMKKRIEATGFTSFWV